ncbi:MAG: hypothetical protein ACK41D_01760 [Rubricoccaceae bacterium]
MSRFFLTFLLLAPLAGCTLLSELAGSMSDAAPDRARRACVSHAEDSGLRVRSVERVEHAGSLYTVMLLVTGSGGDSTARCAFDARRGVARLR